MTSVATVGEARATRPADPLPPKPARLRGNWSYLPFLVPAAVFLVAILVIPSIQGGIYAFTNWNGLSPSFNWVGFDNFTTIFQDPKALGAITNTLALTIVLVVLQNLFGLLLAVALNSAIKSKSLMRLVFFTPVVITPVVVAALWKFMYTPDGPINSILGAMGLDSLKRTWLGDPDITRWAILWVILWQFSGYLMIIYLAGLQNVPTEVIEAARMDGAGATRIFFSVQLPLLRPAVIVGTLLVAISGLKIFDQVWIMTRGGPGTSTHTLSTVIYEEAFVDGKFGYSTAIAVVLTLFTILLALLQLRLTRRKQES